MQESIIKGKTCLHCQSRFEITDHDLQFYTKISPIFAGEKFQIPVPTLCPDCRQRRRLSFRNERALYKRRCDASGKDIVTMYKPDSNYKVYDKSIRWSDARDPMLYGKDFDFGKSFTENFGTLMREVPHCSLYMNECENCDYSNYSNGSKKVYLSYGVTRSEDCLYSHFLYQCRDVIDSSTLFDCNNCFQCTNCQNCSKCYYCNKSEECFDSYYLQNCKNCSFCIACSGLENKQYYFCNQEITKEEFERICSSISHDGVQHLIQKFMQGNPGHQLIVGSEDCSGDNIFFSKSCHHAYNIKNAENCKYISYDPNALESYDVDFAAPKGTQYVYEVLSSLGSSRSGFIAQCWDCVAMYYCFENQGCHDCFGCVGLRNKSYCIFNKQYTKEAYEQEVTKIITHMISTLEWGEFFHPSLSPFGYNETVAQEVLSTHRR